VSKSPTSDQIIDTLRLEPLPGEGGMWAQTWIDERSTGIYYLLLAGDFSALHRLASMELYHYYGGAPAELVLLHADGSAETRMLGMDLAAGHRPAVVVESDTWQGSRTTGDWTLLGTTMAPPFDLECFELGDRKTLIDAYPSMAESIMSLTRAESEELR